MRRCPKQTVQPVDAPANCMICHVQTTVNTHCGNWEFKDQIEVNFKFEYVIQKKLICTILLNTLTKLVNRLVERAKVFKKQTEIPKFHLSY